MVAKGRGKKSTMNKTETEYAELLELRRRAGEVLWYQFEGFRLRLADGAYYTPDFAVMLDNHELECHEVKGFWREAARVRIRVAADLYPFRFVALKKAPRGSRERWLLEEF